MSAGWRGRVGWSVRVVGLLALGALLATHASVTPSSAPCWRAWLVAVERVVDGDTFEAEVQIWPRLTVTEIIRVLGVDTPERGAIEQWKAARDYTIAWLKDSGQTTVTVCRYDHFGRALGAVVSVAKGDLAASLITAGHGVLYPRPKAPRE